MPFGRHLGSSPYFLTELASYEHYNLLKKIVITFKIFLHMVINPNCFIVTYLPVSHMYTEEMTEIQKNLKITSFLHVDVNHVSIT